MKYYVGLDVSRDYTSICVVDAKGKIVAETTAETLVNSIHQCLKRLKLDFEMIGLETGSFTNFLFKGLGKKGWPIKCLCARKMAKLISSNNKTDKNDAREIAQALRANYIKEVHVKSDYATDVNCLLTTRDLLVRQRTMATNNIRGQLRQYGLKFPSSRKVNFSALVGQEIQSLSAILQIGIKALLEVVELLSKEIDALDTRLEEIAALDEDVEILKSMDGVGVITALAFKVAIDDPSRFQHMKDVGAYIGLTPKLYESGDCSVRGKISKCGPSYLRSLLLESSVSMLSRVRRKSQLKTWGHAVSAKRGVKKARVALARKMAVVLFSMLKNKTKFKRDLSTRQEAKRAA